MCGPTARQDKTRQTAVPDFSLVRGAFLSGLVLFSARAADADPGNPDACVAGGGDSAAAAGTQNLAASVAGGCLLWTRGGRSMEQGSGVYVGRFAER